MNDVFSNFETPRPILKTLVRVAYKNEIRSSQFQRMSLVPLNDYLCRPFSLQDGTALIGAATNGHLDVAELLIQFGAQTEFQNEVMRVKEVWRLKIGMWIRGHTLWLDFSVKLSV